MAKGSRKRNRKNSKCMPPQGSKAYFSAASDIEFKEKHPVGYWFLVSLGIFALMLPVLIYLIFVSPLVNNSPWVLLGWLGGFIIGIGLFNFVAIIIKQYLGHWVSIISFLVGGLLIVISLKLMGIM